MTMAILSSYVPGVGKLAVCLSGDDCKQERKRKRMSVLVYGKSLDKFHGRSVVVGGGERRGVRQGKRGEEGGEGRGTGGRWMNDGCDDGDKEKDEQPRGN